MRTYWYKKNQLAYTGSFDAPATAILWVPSQGDATGRTLLVGFGNGVLRVFRLEDSGALLLICALKVAFSSLALRSSLFYSLPS